MSEHKVVIITGGSSGIGFAIATRFTREGYRTIITGRNQTRLEEAHEALGSNCIPIVCDMDDLAGISGFVQKVTAEHGRIDVLINNAGINLKKHMTETSTEEFESIILTNQTALFVMSREVAKVMLKQDPRGVIIHISSMSAHYGIPKIVPYSASKSAVEGMTRAMAVDLSPHGIRVNCIAPGFIKTPMLSKAMDQDAERKQKVLDRTPLRTFGEPSDIADAAFFLASDQARFITGEILKVDGGNSIGF